MDDFTEARELYRAAASNHDAATLVDLFAEDGVLVASDHDVIRGRQDIGKSLASAGDQGMPEVTLTCISAESRNGFGLETGRFEERVTSSEGAVTRVTGVYVISTGGTKPAAGVSRLKFAAGAINSRSDSGSSGGRRAAGGGYFCAAGVATVSVAALSAFAWRPVIETLPQKNAPS